MGAVSAEYAKGCAPVTALSHAGATIARIECDQCGGHDEWRINGRRPPSDILPKHFAQKGWRVAKRVTCPECQSRKEKTVSVTPIKIEPKPDPRAQRRDAHALIELSFNIASGQYKDGYSDERIAKETGISLAWVKQRREDEFGPIKQPSEIAEMRSDLAAALDQVTMVQARLDKLCLKQGWAA